jgi:hypothetical protein
VILCAGAASVVGLNPEDTFRVRSVPVDERGAWCSLLRDPNSMPVIVCRVFAFDRGLPRVYWGHEKHAPRHSRRGRGPRSR